MIPFEGRLLTVSPKHFCFCSRLHVITQISILPYKQVVYYNVILKELMHLLLVEPTIVKLLGTKLSSIHRELFPNIPVILLGHPSIIIYVKQKIYAKSTPRRVRLLSMNTPRGAINKYSIR